MAELLDLLPLYGDESEETIRARWIAWANEGVSPLDFHYVDTRDGGFWSLTVTPGIREFARLYDFMGTEVVAASHPVYAWGDYLDDHAVVFGLERLPPTHAEGFVVFYGIDGTVVGSGAQVGAADADPTRPPIAFEVQTSGVVTGGTVVLPVRAVDPGSDANLSPGALVVPLTQIVNITGRNNVAATTGGTDDETDEALRDRLLAQYVSSASGNQHYYRRVARAQPGVGRVTVVPLWNGPGTVRVVVTDSIGNPVAQSVIDALQATLDPVAGQGVGQGQIGATVTVATATVLSITVAATVEFLTGYALDGGGGSVALRAAIQAAIDNYVASVEPGGEVVRAQVQSRIALILGVHDVGSVTLNGVAANVTVPSSPPRIPRISTYTLTSGTL